MKRVLVLMVLSIAMLTLTSCGKEKVPNEAQMKIDIVEVGANQFYLNQQLEELEITSLTLEKRKTYEEEEYDEAYVKVTFENDRYTVNTGYVLCYTLYDEGGWILDYCETLDYSSAAKSPLYSEEEFLEYLSSSFTSATIEKREHGLSEDGNYSDLLRFSGAIEYPYMTAKVTGYCSMTFCDDMWHQDIVIESVENDFGKMKGEWKYVHESGDYILFNLEDIYPLEDSARFSYETSPWSWRNIYTANNVPYKTEHSSKTFILSWENVELLGNEIKMPVGAYGRICLGSELNEDGTVSDVTGSGTIGFNKDTGCVLEWYTGGGVFAEHHTANLTKVS